MTGDSENSDLFAARNGQADEFHMQRQKRQARDDALNTPNCGACLHRMEPELLEGELVWCCTNCGAVRREG